jgi:hypothetical protein
MQQSRGRQNHRRPHERLRTGGRLRVSGAELEAINPRFTLPDFRRNHARYAGRRMFGDAFSRAVTVFLIEAKSLDDGLDLSPEANRAATIVANRVAAPIEAHVGAIA